MTAPKNRITPGDFSPVMDKREAHVADPNMPPPKMEKPYKAILFIAVLAIVALGLVLFPPGQTQVDDPGNPTPVEANSPRDVVSEDIAAQEQPWADAQLLSARRNAQEVLAKLLPLQKALEQKRVSEWGQESHEEIIAVANQGDVAYQNREFDTAISEYDTALSLAEALMAKALPLAPTYLEQGVSSLAQNQLETALSDLELATLLDPNLDTARTMLSRAQVREEILELEEVAKKHRQSGSFEQAKDTWLSIKALDADYENLEPNVREIDAAILDRDYRAAMSQGFSALSSGELSTARDSFLQAEKLKPSSTAVQEALQQVEAAKTNDQRQIALDSASALEAAEQWRDALQVYENLLAEDPTLTAATLGKIRTNTRANLHTNILTILSEPLKLQDENIWKTANSLLSEAKNIIDRGPVLRDQIEELEFVVTRARTKVTLELTSDSQTNVEIYRVGKLGQFKEQAIALYPGRYVVVGTRSGYRDVREDLVLDGNASRIELTIQCEETI